MELKRLLSLPFTLVADIATCGNIGGDRTFTGQVFDAERREEQREQDRKDALILIEAIKALRKKAE